MTAKQKIVFAYYLATPVFFLLDIFLQWDIRVSFLDEHIDWKIVYYLFCLGIGYIIWKAPSLEYILGIIEGGVNLLLLSLSILLPYYNAIDTITNGGTVSNPLNLTSILNYLIAGLFLIISLQLRNIKVGKF